VIDCVLQIEFSLGYEFADNQVNSHLGNRHDGMRMVRAKVVGVFFKQNLLIFHDYHGTEYFSAGQTLYFR
jgi:hypothetical protein